jgi:hypothetical protein
LKKFNRLNGEKSRKEKKWESEKVGRWENEWTRGASRLATFSKCDTLAQYVGGLSFFDFFLNVYIYLSYFDWVCIFLFILIL